MHIIQYNTEQIINSSTAGHATKYSAQCSIILKNYSTAAGTIRAEN